MKNLARKISIFAAAACAQLFWGAVASAQGKWAGVDEVVVEKFASEAGRAARAPYINTDQGDLLLFVFLLAGIAGGFFLGYWYRVIFVEKRGQRVKP